jgi:hypothetical protein
LKEYKFDERCFLLSFGTLALIRNAANTLSGYPVLVLCQNVVGQIAYRQNVDFQFVDIKMPTSICLHQNVYIKMSTSKCLHQNACIKMSTSKCLHQNGYIKFSTSIVDITFKCTLNLTKPKLT